jgi:hypothetical protein
VELGDEGFVERVVDLGTGHGDGGEGAPAGQAEVFGHGFSVTGALPRFT